MRKKSAAKCQHVHDGHCLIHTSLMATEGNFDITHKFRHVQCTVRTWCWPVCAVWLQASASIFSFEENANLAKDGPIYDTTPSSSAPERVGEGSWFQLHNSGSNRQDDEEIPWHVANVQAAVHTRRIMEASTIQITATKCRPATSRRSLGGAQSGNKYTFHPVLPSSVVDL